MLGPPYIYGDNMSVVCNTSRLESVLRESKAMGFAIMQLMSQVQLKSLSWKYTQQRECCWFNDKVIYGQKRKYLVSNILDDIHDDH